MACGVSDVGGELAGPIRWVEDEGLAKTGLNGRDLLVVEY